jgi:hypothetical protein
MGGIQMILGNPADLTNPLHRIIKGAKALGVPVRTVVLRVR